jgi:hypothetical protein
VKTSDVIFLLAHPSILNIEVSPQCKIKFLYTGVSKKELSLFKEGCPQKKPLCDVAIVGFIEADMDLNLLARISDFIRQKGVKKKLSIIFQITLQSIGSVKSVRVSKLVNNFLLSTPFIQVLKKLQSNAELTIFTLLFHKVICKSYRLFQGEVAGAVFEKRLKKLSQNISIPIFSENFISYFSFSYPRFVERKFLAEKCIGAGFKTDLYGVGWDLYPEFSPKWRGVLSTPEDLGKVYRSAKVNLHSNPNGFGVHSRVLEAMASGGFIMTHSSINEGVKGTITSEFKQNVHFKLYSEKTFIDDVKNAIYDEKMRLQCIKNAYELVSEKHTWKERARQVLIDLHST